MTPETPTIDAISPAVAVVAQLAVPLLATYASPYTDAEVRLAVTDALRIVAEVTRRQAEGAKLAALARQAQADADAPNRVCWLCDTRGARLCTRVGCPPIWERPVVADASPTIASAQVVVRMD